MIRQFDDAAFGSTEYSDNCIGSVIRHYIHFDQLLFEYSGNRITFTYRFCDYVIWRFGIQFIN